MVMSVENDGTVLIKVPKWTRKAAIDRFYRANLGWIADQRRKAEANRHKFKQLSPQDIRRLKAQAKSVLTYKTALYAARMGLKPEYVKITSAKKHWGTCHKKGDKYSICYSYRVMFLPDRVQDYIVVHELAHMVHFDHSAQFHSLVEKILPDRRSLSDRADNFKDYHIY